MRHKDLLTENEVIQGVENFLKQKGTTSHRRVIHKADAGKKEHGVDLVLKLENENKHGNWYFIEAKGNLKADRSEMKSSCNTNFIANHFAYRGESNEIQLQLRDRAAKIRRGKMQKTDPEKLGDEIPEDSAVWRFL